MARTQFKTYFSEFRVSWRYLVTASLGLASGYQITTYITNIFTPHLLQEFGWSKSQLALVGAVGLLTLIGGPIAGRVTDVIGVRRMALVGVIASPLVFLAYASMNGSIWLYLLINCAQIVLMGLTTTSIVYGRLVAQYFNGARGIALAIAACSPALAAALAAPLLSRIIEAHGWRKGYLVLALCSAAGGVGAMLALPPQPPLRPVRRSERDSGILPGIYHELARNPAFQVVIFGLMCCTFPLLVQASQLGIILLDRGLSHAAAAWMISLYASTVVAGRLLCGLALDRWPTHFVVAIALSIPGVGLLVLAAGVGVPIVLAGAVAVLGLSMGAEIDIMTYLVMRLFPAEIFGTVIGLFGAAVALSGSLGSLTLSLTLKLTGGFALFLSVAGVTAIIGGLSFLLLGGSSMAAATRELRS